MTNIYALVEVPALDMTLDVIIPVQLTVAQIISLLARMIYNLTQVSLDEQKLMLCDADAGCVLCEKSALFKASSLKDACRLVII